MAPKKDAPKKDKDWKKRSLGQEEHDFGSFLESLDMSDNSTSALFTNLRDCISTSVSIQVYR